MRRTSTFLRFNDSLPDLLLRFAAFSLSFFDLLLAQLIGDSRDFNGLKAFSPEVYREPFEIGDLICGQALASIEA